LHAWQFVGLNPATPKKAILAPLKRFTRQAKGVPESQWPAHVGNPDIFTPKGLKDVVTGEAFGMQTIFDDGFPEVGKRLVEGYRNDRKSLRWL